MYYEYMNIDGFHMVVPEVKYVADVIVYKIGKYAVAKNRHGEVIAVSEDHAQAIQKAIEKGGKISVLGELELGSKLSIAKDDVILDFNGHKVKCSSGCIELVDTYRVQIRNVLLEGSGSGIGLRITSSNGSKGAMYNKIENVFIRGFSTHLQLDAESPAFVNVNRIEDVFIELASGQKGVVLNGNVNGNTFIKVETEGEGAKGFEIDGQDNIFISPRTVDAGSMPSEIKSTAKQTVIVGGYLSNLTDNGVATLCVTTLQPGILRAQDIIIATTLGAIKTVSDQNVMIIDDNLKAVRIAIPLYTDCADLPSSGDFTGDIRVCYDTGTSTWKLKIWDGSNWQTIG